MCVTNGKRAIVHCKCFQQAICALTFGEGPAWENNKPIIILWFLWKDARIQRYSCKVTAENGLN
ncbi:hypothetical protein SB30_300157 [Klebsiella quasipneumoniae subsp. similipneumoniae]|nr:hypothetical protein SB30_300157 [Klebsiella quasipneumoniae subsp. similipneumoniae]